MPSFNTVANKKPNQNRLLGWAKQAAFSNQPLARAGV